MAQYIDKDALVANVERRIEHNTEWKDACKTLAVLAANQAIEEDKKILSIINTLEVKEVYVSNPQFPHLKDIIDKVFGAGNLEFWEYDDAEQLVLLAKDEVISQVCEAAGMKKPYKDGNQWCILKGENIQEGICGFGDNIEDALVDFLRNIPKIPLKVLKEVNLEKELIEWHKEHFKKDGTFIGMSGFYLTNNSQMDIAKHFFELGLKAQKGE